jgi:hypothetical protein
MLATQHPDESHGGTCACSPCIAERLSKRTALDLPAGACWKPTTPHADAFERNLDALVARTERVAARAAVIRAARMLCVAGQHDAADTIIKNIRRLSQSDSLHRDSASVVHRTIDPVLCD